MSHPSVAIALAAALASTGCLSISSTLPVGKPLDVSPGEPANECEETNFVRVQPARVTARGQDGYANVYGPVTIIHTTTRTEENDGLALYRNGEALELPQAIDDIGANDVARKHRARIRPIDSRVRTGMVVGGTLIGIGAAAALAGGGLAISSADFNRGSFDATRLWAGTGVSLGGALIALAGGVAVLATKPKIEEQNFLATRKQLLLKDEDDFDAVIRAAARHNAEKRTQCRGSQPAATTATR